MKFHEFHTVIFMTGTQHAVVENMNILSCMQQKAYMYVRVFYYRGYGGSRVGKGVWGTGIHP